MKPPTGLVIDAGWWRDLKVRYARPQRAYHTIEHVQDVLGHWAEVDAEQGWFARAETWVAVLLHDVVYDLGPSVSPGSNEAASAALVPSWARAFGLKLDVGAVQRMIEATAQHGSIHATGDLALFLDCDMAILGAPPARYDRYAEQVRQENEPHLSSGIYQPTRASFLRSLSQQNIFLTQRFSQRYEAQAKANLARECATLC